MNITDMKQYKRAALRTMKPHASKELAIADWALGLGGELSEVVELIHNESRDKMELAKELGDVLWYVVALADEVQIALPNTIFDSCMEFVQDRGHCASCVVDTHPIKTAMMGLISNVGSIQERLKHIIMHKEDSKYSVIEGQLHGIIEKISTICFHSGFSIHDVATLNAAKLAHRYNTKRGGKFSTTASANRHDSENKFSDTPIYARLSGKIAGLTVTIPHVEVNDMKVIFEGADGVGKTSLLTLVAEMLNFKTRGRIMRLKPEQVLAENKADLTREGNWILDRCYWLSDIIYEPMCSGKASVIHRASSPHFDFDNTMLVHVTCSESAIRDRIGARGDDTHTIDEILTAKRAYDKFFETYTGRFIEIDTTNGTLEENAMRLCIDIKEEM